MRNASILIQIAQASWTTINAGRYCSAKNRHPKTLKWFALLSKFWSAPKRIHIGGSCHCHLFWVYCICELVISATRKKLSAPLFHFWRRMRMKCTLSYFDENRHNSLECSAQGLRIVSAVYSRSSRNETVYSVKFCKAGFQRCFDLKWRTVQWAYSATFTQPRPNSNMDRDERS